MQCVQKEEDHISTFVCIYIPRRSNLLRGADTLNKLVRLAYSCYP